MKQINELNLVIEMIDRGDLDEEYCEFIINNHHRGDRVICNGDTLIEAMEDCYMLEEFALFYLENQQ